MPSSASTNSNKFDLLGPPFTVNLTFLKKGSLLKKCLYLKERPKKAIIVAFYRVKKSKMAIFVGFGGKKNSLFLTFPNCFGKVGKSDFPIKTRKRTLYHSTSIHPRHFLSQYIHPSPTKSTRKRTVTDATNVRNECERERIDRQRWRNEERKGKGEAKPI